ncbi:MAG: hypothetical protein ACRDZO_15810 [Egibacteraceae bacterium]
MLNLGFVLAYLSKGRIRLGRNDARLPQPRGRTVTVRNGMEGTITPTTRTAIELGLDATTSAPMGLALCCCPRVTPLPMSTTAMR